MANSHGIILEIQSGGKALKCYDDPDATTTETPMFVDKYIEAVTDAAFQILITVTPEFDFGKSDAVEALFAMDGQAVGRGIVTKSECMDKGTFSKLYTSSEEYCEDSGTWRDGAWSFAKLNIKESSDDVDVRISPLELMQLGRIHICLQRVRKKYHRIRPKSFADDVMGYRAVTEVSEKHLKSQAISNSVSIVKGAVIATPQPQEYYYLRLKGAMGKQMGATFSYRSKHALQILGCIPRDPSPDPDPDPITAQAALTPPEQPSITNHQTEPDDSEKSRKIAALKAQLALLERSPNINPKPEPPTVSSSSASKAGIKREYEGVEIVGQRERERDRGRERESKRVRGLGVVEGVEMVDLTGA